MKCSNCDGEGTLEERNCHNYSNECCGGCYITTTCDDCQGSGTVFSEDDEDDDYL